MDAEHEPVSPDEFVLRRVHKSHFDPNLRVPIQKVAVRPTEQDTDGLSVYREREYIGNPGGILADVDEAKRGNYYIARVRVSDIQALGLSVRPEQGTDDLPGHCVIPELNRGAYEANKQALADTILELAKLFGRDVVHTPPSSG